jgi:hypothetical protein
MTITGRDIRDASVRGETINLDWALKKQNDMLWQIGKVQTNSTQQAEAEGGSQFPNEPPLPSNFSRSYSFLATRPDEIRMSDLPQLLNEYKMLVHTTETLLNERALWKDAEKKRQRKLAREILERDYDAMIGTDDAEMSNGHGSYAKK